MPAGLPEPASGPPERGPLSFTLLALTVTTLVNGALIYVAASGEPRLTNVAIGLFYSPVLNLMLALGFVGAAMIAQGSERLAGYILPALLLPCCGAIANVIAMLLIIPGRAEGPPFGSGAH